MKDSAATIKRTFLQRVENPYGADGAFLRPSLPQSMEGIRLSNSIADMLPSEADFLCSTGNNAKILKRLLLAKQVKSKLWSYHLTGYYNVSSHSNTRNQRTKLPSAPGGPIIICLDTFFRHTYVRICNL